jgi:hypothetical protein
LKNPLENGGFSLKRKNERGKIKKKVERPGRSTLIGKKRSLWISNFKN